MILAGELLVHSVQEADLTSTYTYVTRRDVLVWADAAPELKHEGLAETHDLSVRLSDVVEVRTTFAPPIGRVVRAFLNVCSNPRNLSIEGVTALWKRRPPL